MLDENVSLNKVRIELPNINKDLHIKNIGDMHLCESFDNRKLDIIYDYIFSTPTDYILMDGDVIDSTNFIYKNKELVNKYLKWFELISKKNKVFIVLGSHDFSKFENNNWSEDWNNEFWKDVASINNVFVSHFNSLYEDDDIYLFMLEPSYLYYYGLSKKENKIELLKELKNNITKISELPNDKAKILLNHSPLYMTDYDVLNYTSEFNMVFSGHMHAGVIPLGLDKIFPGNRGIIAPKKSLFPDNARGIKKIKLPNGDIQTLIITGGITKLQECSGFFQKFNKLYKMDIDDVLVKSKKI